MLRYMVDYTKITQKKDRILYFKFMIYKRIILKFLFNPYKV